MWVTRSDIPKWLHKSTLYKAINESEEEFEISEIFYLETDVITDLNDWIHVKEVCDYWNTNIYSFAMIVFSLRNKDILEEYYQSLEPQDAFILKEK